VRTAKPPTAKPKPEAEVDRLLAEIAAIQAERNRPAGTAVAVGGK